MAIKLPGLKSQLWLKRGDLAHEWGSLEKKVQEHPFNHAVELVIPGVLQLPRCLSNEQPLSYYTSQALPLAQFIRPELIERYLTSGSFSALSIYARIDTDNVFAVLPEGVLLLSLDKDTYEQLGLQGKPSKFQKQQRYVVEVDLTAAQFKPDKPNYKRVERCLTGSMQMQGDFIISWAGKGIRHLQPVDQVHAAGEADEAQFLADFKAEKRHCLSETELLQNFPLPKVKGDSPNGQCGDAAVCDAQNLHTWLGTVANGVNECYSEGGPGNYVSTFVPPDPHSVCGHGVRKRWVGMVQSQHICATLQQIRESLSSLPSEPGWACLSVWGFEDAPVSWKNNEHGSCLSSDNSYSVVLFRSGEYWLVLSLGGCDVVL